MENPDKEENADIFDDWFSVKGDVDDFIFYCENIPVSEK